MAKILLVEDDLDIAGLIEFNLSREGWDVIHAENGIDAVNLALKEQPDVIILDLMLPGKDGFTVFSEIKANSEMEEVPVIMLTAKAQTDDRIKGLSIGADDYLTKPFSPKELVLRVKTLLKFSKISEKNDLLEIGHFSFNKGTMRFAVDQEEVDLTSTEFKLILYLCEREGKILERATLLEKVWGYNSAVNSRTLDTHIKRIRSKIGVYAGHITTLRGVGYKYDSSATID